MRRSKTKLLCASALSAFLVVGYLLGVLDHMSEKTFTKEFHYPLNVDILPLVEQIRFGIDPDVDPINYYDYTFIDTLESKCPGREKPRLVILVKSAMNNFNRRAVIRKTWGLERRFHDTIIKTVFLLGVEQVPDAGLRQKIELEKASHGDILQSDFIDSYFNNTIKTMMGFRWAYEMCPLSDFYLFSDDDMFISVKNLLKFLQNPANYPEYKNALSRKARNPGVKFKSNKVHSNKKSKLIREVATQSFFAGFVFKSSPLRHKTSKWYIPLDEYPWDMWPPYVTAGAYVVSNEALKDMYAASYFTKHFKFDDIYLAIIAMKLGIVPYHCAEFYFYKKPYSPSRYKYMIASHGYDDPNELERVWTAQLTGGRV